MQSYPHIHIVITPKILKDIFFQAYVHNTRASTGTELHISGPVKNIGYHVHFVIESHARLQKIIHFAGKQPLDIFYVLKLKYQSNCHSTASSKNFPEGKSKSIKLLFDFKSFQTGMFFIWNYDILYINNLQYSFDYFTIGIHSDIINVCDWFKYSTFTTFLSSPSTPKASDLFESVS